MEKNRREPMGKDAREFWNRRAETFPRYDEGDNTYEAGMLRRIAGMGVDFTGRNILDVGCGSGQYTIRFAMMGKSVTALDVSEKMLDVLRKDAETHGLNNIEYVHSDWLDFSDRRAYDIVFCSMTPALFADEGKQKLLDYEGAKVVYMGFREKSPSEMLRGLYTLYNEEAQPCNSAEYMRAWLDAQKIDYQLEMVTGQWVQHMTLDEALSLCMATAYNFAVTPLEEDVRKYLERLVTADGSIEKRTRYAIDIIVWENA